MQTASVTFVPLQPFGVEVRGVDFRDEQPGEIKAQLRRAWQEHSLLLFRDQEITPEQQLRIATIFGKFSDEGDTPGGINFVSNVYEKGTTSDGQYNLDTPGEKRFHRDHSFYEAPLRGIMLYGIEVPPVEKGGDTRFSDSRAAYKRLPAELRERIANLIVHFACPQPSDMRQADHPVALKHPDTGEPILFLSRRHAHHIVGLSHQESEALLDELDSYVGDPAITYRHHWRPNDLVVWDNLSLEHARDDWDRSCRRHLRRTQIG